MVTLVRMSRVSRRSNMRFAIRKFHLSRFRHSADNPHEISIVFVVVIVLDCPPAPRDLHSNSLTFVRTLHLSLLLAERFFGGA